MPSNDIKNPINHKKKVNYDGIKKIVKNTPNYKVENNIKNKFKKLINRNPKKEIIDYVYFKIN